MLKELLNKEVIVHMGILSSFTDYIKGNIIEMSDDWIKLKTKKSIEFININKIARIALKES
jgi:hypothetical protein